jgi:hypothetical protein
MIVVLSFRGLVLRLQLQSVDPLLGNDRETNNETRLAARQQILNKQQLNYNSEELCFLSSPCWDVITRRVWNNSSVVGYLPDSNDVNTEAKESPLLRSVIGKRIIKAD